MCWFDVLLVLCVDWFGVVWFYGVGSILAWVIGVLFYVLLVIYVWFYGVDFMLSVLCVLVLCRVVLCVSVLCVSILCLFGYMCVWFYAFGSMFMLVLCVWLYVVGSMCWF